MKKERNMYMNNSSTLLTIKILKETIAWFKTQIEPHDCGWMYTTIDGLKHRIKELRKEEKNFSKIKQEPWIKGYKEWKEALGKYHTRKS